MIMVNYLTGCHFRKSLKVSDNMYCRATQQDMYWDEAQRYASEISANMSKFFSEHTEYDTIEKQAEFFKEVVKALNNQADDFEKFMMMYVPPESKDNVE